MTAQLRLPIEPPPPSETAEGRALLELVEQVGIAEAVKQMLDEQDKAAKERPEQPR